MMSSDNIRSHVKEKIKLEFNIDLNNFNMLKISRLANCLNEAVREFDKAVKKEIKIEEKNKNKK